MTAGFYDDDFLRQFWKNQEAYKSLQKMMDAAMAPAVEAIRQSMALDALQKQMAAAVLPAMDHSAFNAMKSFAKMMPVIDVPKIPNLNFGNITQLKLGDDFAQKFVESVDVEEMNKSVAPPVEHEPASVPQPPQDEPEGPAEVDLKHFKEADLDQFVDVLYMVHPHLPQELESNPELSKLDDRQKKVISWLLALMVMCGMSVLHTWGTYDESVASATAVVEQLDLGISGSDDIMKVILRKDEDEESEEEREQEAEDDPKDE